MKKLLLILVLVGIVSVQASDYTGPTLPANEDGTETLLKKIAKSVSSTTATSGSVATATTSTSVTGAGHVAASQVTTSGTAGTLVVARPTRRSCLVRNTDATISVYIGPATVSASNGMILKAGESTVITAVTLWQVIAASGTPVVAVLDEYD